MASYIAPRTYARDLPIISTKLACPRSPRQLRASPSELGSQPSSALSYHTAIIIHYAGYSVSVYVPTPQSTACHVQYLPLHTLPHRRPLLLAICTSALLPFVLCLARQLAHHDTRMESLTNTHQPPTIISPIHLPNSPTTHLSAYTATVPCCADLPSPFPLTPLVPKCQLSHMPSHLRASVAFSLIPSSPYPFYFFYSLFRFHEA
ncbi:hypothetical protein F4824DRAFT_25964 [Ustulina deusta]|nr:hypothetical protein F4824DRAFT_25964 [Ustulina deusta]